MKRLFVFVLLFLNGCAVNPFTQFYYDLTGGSDITKSQDFVLTSTKPKLFKGTNVDEEKHGVSP